MEYWNLVKRVFDMKSKQQITVMGRNKFAAPTTSRVFTKPEFQKLRADFARQKMYVDAISGGYELRHPKGLLLKAMVGSRGYLVRYVSNLFASTPHDLKPSKRKYFL